MIKVCFTRTNSMRGDSRVEKEMEALVNNKYSVIGIAWDRQLDESDIYVKEINNIKINITEIKIKADFCGGFKKNIIPLLRFQFQLFKKLVKNKNNIDVVHACDFDTALCSAIFCKIYKKKLVYDIFDFYVDSFSVPKLIRKLILKMDFWVIKKADATIICTDERRKQIIGSKPQNLYIVQNSPKKNNSLLNYKLKSNSNNKKICYFGILSEDRLIKELVEIISKKRNVELHIGGFGKYENFIKNMAKNFENIYFYGKLDYSVVLCLEQQCDIMVALYNPKIRNHYFAAPNKFYEGIMLGKPLIMCKNTGMSNIVESNKIGVVIEEFNKECLEKAIDSLIKNSNNWEKISKKSNKIYDELYSWDVSEKNLLKCYEGLFKEF